MKSRDLVIWVLIQLTGWAIVFGHFQRHFDGVEIEKKKVARLEKAIRQSERNLVKMESRFSEYKDAMVASGLKIDSLTPLSSEKRNLASVVSDPAYKEQILWPAGTISYRHAKKVFTTGNYSRAAELLEEFLQKYPDHPQLPEATYLLSESYTALGNKEDSLRALNLLISHFPETESACLGLLRLGKIFEKDERLEDALEIYQMALPLHPKSNCENLAKSSLNGLHL